MQSRQRRLEAMRAVSRQGHEWEIGMCSAPCEAPGDFCYGCCCPCCAAYQQREEILDITGEPYIPFNGMCGCCSCCGCTEPQDDNIMCYLSCEVCCCTGIAASINRILIQTRFAKENNDCDNCMITCTSMMLCCAHLWRCVACICVCFGVQGADQVDDVADCCYFVANAMYLTMLGCWYAQQQVELEHISEVGYQGVKPEIFALLPPGQQQMINSAYH